MAQAFQSTPLCEGRRFFDGLEAREKMFQSTPLCEGRQVPSIWIGKVETFQSTPLCEGRPKCPTITSERSSFNPRPSARGDE